jgi:hypothetical protein
MMVGAVAAKAWDSEENQVWLQASAETAIYTSVKTVVAEDGTTTEKASDKLKLKVAQEIRFKDSGSDEFYHHTDFTLSYLLGDGWSVAGIYRYQDKERTNGEWLADNMGLFDLCKKQVFAGVELTGRARLTYTDKRSTDDDPWEIRPRLEVAPAKGWTSWKLKPYLADEMMYDLSEDRFYRNRIYAGLKAAPVKKLCTNLFVMQDNTESSAGDWKEYFVFGGCVALKF